jgi:hypothetical protein
MSIHVYPRCRSTVPVAVLSSLLPSAAFTVVLLWSGSPHIYLAEVVALRRIRWGQDDWPGKAGPMGQGTGSGWMGRA